MNKKFLGTIGLVTSLSILGACGNADDSSSTENEGKETITFVNHKTDWEQSKVDLANGKIGAMVLGSWAVPQVQ